ncbi:MAG: hypothetical protein E6813_28685, partial [Bradyrhizobium sp.]|uniref:hypothetical protein n=1 Tax=Bradyrhizobium sp. TaxID=376 RepID=UPI002900835B
MALGSRNDDECGRRGSHRVQEHKTARRQSARRPAHEINQFAAMGARTDCSSTDLIATSATCAR